MKKQSSREKIESQFLLITGVLLSLIGGPAFFNLVKEPVLETAKITRQDSRTPANVNDTQEKTIYTENKKAIIEKNAILKYNCEEELADDKKNQEVNSSQLRISGNGCKKQNQISISNKTNGFTAEIIFTKEGQFTTDYIDLSVGQNDLEVVSILKDGSQVKQNIKVSRRAPASL